MVIVNDANPDSESTADELRGSLAGQTRDASYVLIGIVRQSVSLYISVANQLDRYACESLDTVLEIMLPSIGFRFVYA